MTQIDRTNLKLIFFVPILTLCLASCASKAMTQRLEKLERNQIAISSEQSRLGESLEELSNSLLVIQDRLESLKVSVERKPPARSGSASAKTGTAVEEKPVEKKTQVHRKIGHVDGTEFLISSGPDESSLPPITLTNKDIAKLEKRYQIKPGEKNDAAVKTDTKVNGSTKPGRHVAAAENPQAINQYNRAYDLYQAGDYVNAVKGLQQFVNAYPDHSYADNALYWIGESFYQTKNYQLAAQNFEKVAEKFPTGNKVPDALMRAGLCYMEMNQEDEARKTFQRVINVFPQSMAARKAKTALVDIAQTAAMQKGRM